MRKAGGAQGARWPQRHRLYLLTVCVASSGRPPDLTGLCAGLAFGPVVLVGALDCLQTASALTGWACAGPGVCLTPNPGVSIKETGQWRLQSWEHFTALCLPQPSALTSCARAGSLAHLGDIPWPVLRASPFLWPFSYSKANASSSSSFSTPRSLLGSLPVSWAALGRALNSKPSEEASRCLKGKAAGQFPSHSPTLLFLPSEQ